MTKINPNLLKGGEARNMQPRNSSQMSILTVMKVAVSSAIEKIFKENTMKVQFDNEKELQAGLQRILQALNQQKKDLQIGKAQLTTQKIDSFEVSNLETLTLQNVEKLAIAFEQLKPIITALQTSNKLDQQTVALLKNVAAYIAQVNSSVKSIKIDFPVGDILDALHGVEASVHAIKLDVPMQRDIKFPEFPKSVSMTEGKAILTALQKMADKLDSLPKAYPEMIIPKTVSIDNFPPQKYPLPVTNINLNPLRGFVQSTAITVSTVPVALPATPLAFRRSLVLYNNDPTITLYVGGEFVSIGQGTPVPPLSYSPAFDAGVKMTVYGIAVSPINVRVLEASNDTYTRGD